MIMSVIQKENAIVKTLLRELASHGFAMRIYEGEDWAGPTTANPDTAFEMTHSTDQDTVYLYVRENALDGMNQELKDFYAAKKAKEPNEKSFAYGSVLLVYGNDGYDVIADNTTSIEPFIEKTSALADAIEEGAGITPKLKESVVLETFINEMIEHGFTIRVHDGEEWAGPATKNAQTALAMTRSTDEDTICMYVRESDLSNVSEELKSYYSAQKEANPEKAAFQFASALMVYGNDGYDVIADHSARLQPFMVKTEAVIEAIENETYDFNIDYDQLAEQALKEKEPSKAPTFDGPSM